MKKIIQLKLNMDLKGYKKGSIICAKINNDGKLFDVFWRSRLLDGCVEEYKDNSIKPQKDKFKKLFKKEGIKDDNI